MDRGWKQLSATSRYLRFMRNKEKLPDQDLTYLTEIDYSKHFAWAAETFDSADTLVSESHGASGSLTNRRSRRQRWLLSMNSSESGAVTCCSSHWHSPPARMD